MSTSIEIIKEQKEEYIEHLNELLRTFMYIEFKNVGDLSPEMTTRLSALIADLFEKVIDLNPSRMYIEFQPTERHLWGWNGKTFHIPDDF